jgi:hypothetical protein
MDGTGLEERVHWWCSWPKGYAKKSSSVQKRTSKVKRLLGEPFAAIC